MSIVAARLRTCFSAMAENPPTIIIAGRSGVLAEG